MKPREVIAECCEGPLMETGLEDADAIIAALDAAGFRIYDTATHIAIYRTTWELACRSCSLDPLAASQES